MIKPVDTSPKRGRQVGAVEKVKAKKKIFSDTSLPVERVDSSSTTASLPQDSEICKKPQGFTKAGAASLQQLNSFTRSVNQAVQSFQADQPKSGVKVNLLLSSLRKRFDDVHVEVQRRAEEVARYKEGIRQADSAEHQIANDRARLRQRAEELTQTLTDLQKKVTEAAQRKTVYHHMLQRTKMEKDIVRQKTLLLQERLKSLGLELKEGRRALEKQQRTKYKVTCEAKQLEQVSPAADKIDKCSDSRLRGSVRSSRQSRAMQARSCHLQELKGERLVRQQGLKEMDDAIELKKAAIGKRQRLVEWQQSVVDEAAAAALSASSGRWRRMLCVEKLVANSLQKTSVENVEKWQYKEDTFQKIREATGLVDVMKIVSKFLNRDLENQKLKEIAAEAERKLEASRKDYQEVIRRAVEDLALGNCSHIRNLYAALDAQAHSWNKIVHSHAARHHLLNSCFGSVEKAKQCATSINANLVHLGIEKLLGTVTA